MREKAMKILKKSAGILFLLTVTSILGCIEEKSEYTINPDGSGKVTVDITSTSPADISHTGPEASPTEQIKPAIERILKHSQGIDTWKDISFGLTDEGAIHFTGTAYFPDINNLAIHGGGLDTLSQFRFSTSPSGQIILELTSYPDRKKKGTKEALNFSDTELAEQVKLAKLRYNQSKAMMTMMLNGLKQDSLMHLPAKIETISNLQRMDDTTVRWQLEGSKILEKMEQKMTDDEWLKRQIRETGGTISDRLDESLVNEIIFGQKGPVQVILSSEFKNLFDYNTEVTAAKANYDNMLKELDLCQTESILPFAKVPATSILTTEPGTVRVGGMQLVKYTDEERGIRHLHSSNGYTLSLVLELPEPNLPITHGRLETAITDTNESLQERSSISFPRLSKDGKAVVFEVSLSLPGKEVKGLAELSGTLVYLKSNGTKKIDLGLMDFKEGATSDVKVFSIRSINPSWNKKDTKMELKANFLIGAVKSTTFYREDGTEMKVSPSGYSSTRDRIMELYYEIKGEFPPRGRIVFEVLDNPTKHEIHFELRNISLTGEPLSDID